MRYVIPIVVALQTAICHIDPAAAALTKCLLWDVPKHFLSIIM